MDTEQQDMVDASEIESNGGGGEALPKGWLTAYLSDLVVSMQPGFPSGQHNKDGLGVPHLRPMNISREGNVDLSDVKYVQVSEYPRLNVGDVLFNNTNSPEWVGKTAYIQSENDWTYSNHMTRIRFYENTLEPKWIAHYLQYLQTIGFFKMYCTNHVNQASINTGFLSKNFLVPLAPLNEQKRIVEVIEAQFTRLDAGVAALKRLQANLKRYKAAVLKAACEGRLVEQDPNDEPANVLLERILEERRAKWAAEQRAKGRDPRKVKYEEPAAPDVDDLPELPEGWVWANIDSCVVWSLYGPRFSSDDYAENGVPIIRTTDINGRGKIDLSDVPRLRLMGKWIRIDTI